MEEFSYPALSTHYAAVTRAVRVPAPRREGLRHHLNKLNIIYKFSALSRYTLITDMQHT